MYFEFCHILIFIFNFINFTTKNWQIDKNNHTPKLTKPPYPHNAMDFCIVRLGIQMELHIKFSIFNIEYILCTYPPPQKNDIADLELEKI